MTVASLPPAKPSADNAQSHALNQLPSWDLTPFQLGDLELLIKGVYAPLRGYLSQENINRVITKYQLSDGTFWPYPLALVVSEKFAAQLEVGAQVVLRDEEGVAIALLTLAEKWLLSADLAENTLHYQAATLSSLNHSETLWCLSGDVQGLEWPTHYDFDANRLIEVETPSLAWHAETVMHQPQIQLAHQLAQAHNLPLVIQTNSGKANDRRPGFATRIRCYQNILHYFNKAQLNIIPSRMSISNERSALWAAMIAQNLGHTHFALDPFCYGEEEDFEALQKQLLSHQDKLSINILETQRLHYDAASQSFISKAEGGKPSTFEHTGSLKKVIEAKQEIPAWFSHEDVLDELRQDWAPNCEKGLTLFLTGLSGAGKSSVANALMTHLRELGGRKVSLLDGDIVRQHLSSELNFSKAHRDLNILRIGFVASEIAKHGGIAICAPIAPYHKTRHQVREMVNEQGSFIEIYISTPIDVCEQRDRKGLYAKARSGQIKGFTGIDDPYEAPENAEIVVDTAELSQHQAVEKITAYLIEQGYLKPHKDA